MRALLTEGQRLRADESGAVLTVGARLGGGGQGEVYVAEMGGHQVAVKWYFPDKLTVDTGLRDRLRMVVRRGSPSPAFLWPSDLAVSRDVAGFGYIMPLREARFRDFTEVMTREVNPSFRALVTAGFQLSDGYHRLHALGLCYRDISFGNVAFDPQSGEVRICDNDNVDVNGKPGAVFVGTPHFLAPELVQGHAVQTARTDLWSLAVLLFHAFMLSHPLRGRREIEMLVPDEASLYGSEALFIFDPDDRSNEPVPGYHDNALAYWPIYPAFLRRLFIRAFTLGIRDPENGRVLEPEWRNAMVTLRDSVIHCAHCGAENFYDPETPDAVRQCWSCDRALGKRLCITVSGLCLVIDDNAALFPHHLEPGRRLDFSAPIACVSRHPDRPELVGLKNLSDRLWRAILPDGQERIVDRARTIALRPGMRIVFGRVEGVVG
jgi:eukaryotic-like serine/threonine-protein kinase